MGAAAAWSSAKVSASAIVFTDSTGKAHTYTKKSTGGYAAPASEYGIASLDRAGLPVLTDEDGTVYAFGKDGRIALSGAERTHWVQHLR